MTHGGCWEQLKSGEATHLPFRAGHKWMHTAKAGFLQEELALFLLFYCRKCDKFENFFRIYDFSERKHLQLRDKSVIIR